jgi:hypothetical protein
MPTKGIEIIMETAKTKRNLWHSAPVMRFCRQIAIAVAAVAVVACSGGEHSAPSGQERSIEFGMAKTRGVAVTELRKVGVFGYSHTGSFGDDLATRPPNYFLNEALVDIPGNGTWTYNGVVRYWPTDETTKLSFFAYAPYIDVENIFVLHPLSPSPAVTGAPTITYSVPANMLDQIDILWCNDLDMTYSMSDSGQIELFMEHALTKIDVQVKLDANEMGRPFVVQFNSISIGNVVGGGTLDMSSMPYDIPLWTTTRPTDDSGWASYTITPGGHGGMANVTFDARNTSPQPGDTDPWVFNSMLKTGQNFMLIPQDISGHPDGLTPARLVLDYTYTNVLSGEVVNVTDTIPLATSGLMTWMQGMGITYQITLSLVSGTVIEFDIEGFINGQPWIPVNDPNGTAGDPGGPIHGTVN